MVNAFLFHFNDIVSNVTADFCLVFVTQSWEWSYLNASTVKYLLLLPITLVPLTVFSNIRFSGQLGTRDARKSCFPLIWFPGSEPIQGWPVLHCEWTSKINHSSKISPISTTSRDYLPVLSLITYAATCVLGITSLYQGTLRPNKQTDATNQMCCTRLISAHDPGSIRVIVLFPNKI